MADTHGAHDEGTGPGLLSNAIALIAFVIVMAVVIWGLLHMANLSTSWFSSLFPRRSPTTAASRSLPLPVLHATTTASVSRRSAPIASLPPSSSAPRGPADIAVRILSATPSSGPSDLATVEFDIANVGGSPSGSYEFTAYLPGGGYAYESSIQYPLAPGGHVVNTLRFSQSQGGAVTIVVHAGDADQSNDTASARVAAPQRYYSY